MRWREQKAFSREVAPSDFVSHPRVTACGLLWKRAGRGHARLRSDARTAPRRLVLRRGRKNRVCEGEIRRSAPPAGAEQRETSQTEGSHKQHADVSSFCFWVLRFPLASPRHGERWRRQAWESCVARAGPGVTAGFGMFGTERGASRSQRTGAARRHTFHE